MEYTKIKEVAGMNSIEALNLMEIKRERSIAIDALKRIIEHLDFIAGDELDIDVAGFIASRALSRIEDEESNINEGSAVSNKRKNIQDEWISVDDRLPITKTDMSGRHFHLVRVLIATKCGEVYSDKFESGNTVDFWCHFKDYNASATHWMPLPQPPQQDGSQ
jgi:hypothetical protein